MPSPFSINPNLPHLTTSDSIIDTKYILAIDPSKSSTGIVLLRKDTYTNGYISFSITDYGVISMPAVSKQTKHYSYIVDYLLHTIKTLVNKYSLSQSNCFVMMENLILGKQTSSLLYYLFQSIIQWFTLIEPMNILTVLPLSLKAFIKTLVPKPPAGIIDKVQIRQIYDQVIQSSNDSVYPKEPFLTQNFNDDILDAYFLAILGLLVPDMYLTSVHSFISNTHLNELGMLYHNNIQNQLTIDPNLILLQHRAHLPKSLIDINSDYFSYLAISDVTPITQESVTRVYNFLHKTFIKTYAPNYENKFFYPIGDAFAICNTCWLISNLPLLYFHDKAAHQMGFTLTLNQGNTFTGTPLLVQTITREVELLAQILNTSVAQLKKSILSMADPHHQYTPFVSFNAKGFFLVVP